MRIMSFEEFLATGRPVADLRVEMADALPLDCYTEVMPGVVYGDSRLGYIEGPNPSGIFTLDIGNFGDSSPEPAELAKSLYCWWLSECADGDPSEIKAALAAAPANPYRDVSMSKGPSLRVSTDGGRTHRPVTEVRLSFGPVGEDDAPAEVLLTVTSEGVITDVVRDGEVVASDSITFDELVARLTP